MNFSLIKNDDKYLFRRLLKSFAKLKNDVWTLDQEWQCFVCSKNFTLLRVVNYECTISCCVIAHN